MKLELENIKVGMYVTISKNKETNDRSWTEEVLKILAINENNVQVELTANHGFSDNTTILTLSNHDFFDASGFIIKVTN